MVRSLVANDPHRLKALKGPEQKLDPHPLSCGLSDLPAHARSLDASRPLAVDLFSGAGGLSLGLHRALGYREVGRLREAGYKSGKWLDCVYMERDLAPAQP